MYQPKYDDLLDLDTPLIYSDGSEMYRKLANQYKTHKKGYFILAPSGAGKTHFIGSQAEPHWLDGDDLWMLSKAMPEGEWWLEDLPTIFEIERRCDIITEQAKKLGFWIMGASNHYLQPDAIVLPHWMTHKKWIGIRERGDYDGGATLDKWGQVLNHRRVIRGWARKGVPQFKTIKEATDHLASL